MSAALENLTRRANDLQSAYQYGFAGKPRVTRRIAQLDKLIADTTTLLKEVNATPSSGDLSAVISERLAMYRSERTQIVDAQKGPVELRRATQLGMRANFYFAVYARHFAGKSRTTRDITLLDDAVAALEEISSELGAIVQSSAREVVEDHLRTIEENVTLYVNEREAILAARADAPTDQRTSSFAHVANQQFEWYRNLFAGKSRLSRRPALLERLVSALAACREGMTGLLDAPERETNLKNIELVETRLDAYRRELVEIRKAREKTSVFELIDALGEAANTAMSEYGAQFAGQDRATRDLTLLSAIIDQLMEVERQMWAIGKVYPNQTNEQNIVVVHDTLASYHTEFERIRDAQRPQEH